MKYFFITFGIFSFIILIMAIGVIFSGKRINGSCGGLGKILGKDCDFCENKNECTNS